MKRTGRQKDIVTPEKKQEQRELLRLFSANIRKILKNTDLLADDLQEIRLRTGAPLLVVAKDQEYFLTCLLYTSYFRCPSCHQQVRVPKGKGHIEIRCPKCGTKFIKNT